MSGVIFGPDDEEYDRWADGNGCLPGAIVSGYVLRRNPDIDYQWNGTEWLPLPA